MALDDRKEYGVLPTDGLPEGSYDVAGPIVFLNSLAKKSRLTNNFWTM